MKGIKYLTTFIVIAAFVLSGCARQPWNTLADDDGDGIANQYEWQNNQNTCQIKCYKQDGTYTCMNAVVSPDVNCNGIEDGLEAGMSPSGESTYINDDNPSYWWAWLGGGILGGFTLGYLYESRDWDWWPFGDDDGTNYYKNIVSIDYSKSKISWEEDLGSSVFMRIVVVATCANDKGDTRECTLNMRISHENALGSEWQIYNSNGKKYYFVKLEYFFNYAQSFVNGLNINFITVTGADPKNPNQVISYSTISPTWFGLRSQNEPPNESVLVIETDSSNVLTGNAAIGNKNDIDSISILQRSPSSSKITMDPINPKLEGHAFTQGENPVFESQIKPLWNNII